MQSFGTYGTVLPYVKNVMIKSIMRRKLVVDLKINYQGGFLLKDGDLQLMQGDDCTYRLISLRLRTPSSCTLWPGVGITRFAGKPNTAQTWTEMRNSIMYALTRDSIFQNVFVKVAGNSTGEVAINVSANGESGALNVFSLNSGIIKDMPEVEATETVYQTDKSTTLATKNKYLARNHK